MPWEKPKFDKFGFTQFGWQARYHEKLKLGKNVKIGAFTKLDCAHGITLEDNVDIASNCSIVSHSTVDGGKQGQITIKENARIGANSVILPNVTIGKNSVIGALSLVKGSVPDNELWAGIPAKKIRGL
jgi:acetyltransferase-like isoleucine patch superfamily enzyme